MDEVTGDLQRLHEYIKDELGYEMKLSGGTQPGSSYEQEVEDMVGPCGSCWQSWRNKPD